MDLGLRGKRALVVGGGRGLGRGVAQALSEEGAHVAIASRDAVALQVTAAEISKQTGSPVLSCQLDTGRAASIEHGLEHIGAALGGIDILVNNSGGPPPTGAAGVPITLWRQQFEMMVLGVIQMTDLVLPPMRAAGWGRNLTQASTGVI
jgi:3-oxoacyl-[acyl-carrier protein] reductase